MECEICHRDSNEARFCSVCIAAFAKILAQQGQIKQAVKESRTPLLRRDINTHYRVSYRGFCCYVDIRQCAHMDEAPAYALDTRNCEPWYPCKDSFSEIPFVTAVTHSKFADWLKER